MASSLDVYEANDVEDPVDRAMRYRQFDKSRVPLKLIVIFGADTPVLINDKEETTFTQPLATVTRRRPA